MKTKVGRPSESALLALQRATHATLHLLAAKLSDLDLTGSEINALANLAGGDGQTISALGRAVGARPTTLTSVLDRLERRGYLTRRPSATDRRAVIIQLTESGQQVAERIRETMTSLERRALDALPEDAVSGFFTVLAALTGVSS